MSQARSVKIMVSAVVIIALAIPVSVVATFFVMYLFDISLNIMSLGGIAIAVGAMVDAAIVMIENAHKHLERYHHSYGHAPKGKEHWQVITRAAAALKG